MSLKFVVLPANARFRTVAAEVELRLACALEELSYLLGFLCV